MSTNNLILVKEGSKYWKVTMIDAENGYKMGKTVKHSALREAVEHAQRLLEDEWVEYGIHFQFKK